MLTVYATLGVCTPVKNVDFNVDTDLSQHSLNYFRYLTVHCITAFGSVQSDAKTIGIASLGQQLLGLFDIVLIAANSQSGIVDNARYHTGVRIVCWSIA